MSLSPALKAAGALAPKRRSRVWTKLRASPAALFGGVLVAFFIAVAV